MTQENTLIALRDLAARCVASVAPLVAEYLPIGEAIELLKLGAVDHLMKEKRLPVPAVATHLSMSLRWAYKFRTMLKKGTYQHLQRPPARLQVLDFFRHRAPEAATMTECLRALEAQRSPIQAEELAELLDAYCGLGYLEAGDGRYRWRFSPLFMNSAELVGRARHTAGLVALMGKALRQFVETDDGTLKHLHVTITRSAYQQMRVELDEAMKDIVKRAIERSIEEDPQGLYTDSVNLDAIVLIGTEHYRPIAKE